MDVGSNNKWLLIGRRGSLGGDENVLILIVVMVAQLCE